MRITFPVSVINNGPGNAGTFGMTAAGFAVEIALPASGQVTLRGLIIDGANAVGGAGIVMQAAGSLAVEKCDMSGFHGSGQKSIGLWVSGSGANVTVSDSRFMNNEGGGVLISNNATVAIRRSAAIGNGLHGYSFINTSGSPTTISATIEDSIASQNTAGVYASGGSGLRITMVRVNATSNVTDLNNVDATMRSDGTTFYYRKTGALYVGPLN